jgi:hypothetical protein
MAAVASAASEASTSTDDPRLNQRAGIATTVANPHRAIPRGFTDDDDERRATEGGGAERDLLRTKA